VTLKLGIVMLGVVFGMMKRRKVTKKKRVERRWNTCEVTRKEIVEKQFCSYCKRH